MTVHVSDGVGTCDSRKGPGVDLSGWIPSTWFCISEGGISLAAPESTTAGSRAPICRFEIRSDGN